MKPLLPVFLLYCLLVDVQAEKENIVSVPPQLLHIGSVSPPIFGNIDGEGYLDFANVSFTFDYDGGQGNSGSDTNSTVAATEPPISTAPENYYAFVEPTTLKLIAITTTVKDHSRKDDAQYTNTFTAQQQQPQSNNDNSTAEEDNTIALYNYLANELGIGAFSPSDGHYYACCDDAAKRSGACTPRNNEALFFDAWNFSQWGSLILDPSKTSTSHTRHFEILPTITYHPEIDLGSGGVLQMSFEAAGHLALVFANCAPSGPNQLKEGEEPDPHTIHTKVHLQGTINFVSYVSASTLPLYVALTAGHVLLTIWFRRLMTQNEESRIRVEGWILWALVLAAVAILVKTILYTLEAFGDDSYLMLQLFAAFAKSIAHGVSRCVYLLVALGIGVVSNSPTQNAMSFMTVWLLLYIPSKLLLDLDIIYGESQWMEALTAIAVNLFLTLNLLFMVWIPMAIRQTIAILKASNEPLKLQRYEWVWRIYLLAVSLAVAQIIMVIITSSRQDLDLFMTQEEQNDVIYFVILACIAYLWRPNPSQQMYAYALLDLAGQMPSTMDLELTQQESLEGRYDDDGYDDSDSSNSERGPTTRPIV